MTESQEVHTIHVNQTQIEFPELSTILSLLLALVSSVTALRGIIQQQGTQIMSALDDLNNAVAAIQTADSALQAADVSLQDAVNTAVTLIQSLHVGGGSVSDADVEAAVAKLTQAASDVTGGASGLTTATASLAGAKPQP